MERACHELLNSPFVCVCVCVGGGGGGGGLPGSVQIVILYSKQSNKDGRPLSFIVYPIITRGGQF